MTQPLAVLASRCVLCAQLFAADEPASSKPATKARVPAEPSAPRAAAKPAPDPVSCLLGDAVSFVTGRNLAVDGGWTAW